MADPVRRVVTGHDDNARAVFHSDEAFAPQNNGNELPEVQP
ncbi:MAG: hypothetical protein OXC05_06240 [Halieaceae bacterium]|nr:hypothetical protein [Halieaceae bacterium]